MNSSIDSAHDISSSNTPQRAGGFYNVATQIGPTNRYNIFHVAAGSRSRRRLASIPTAGWAPGWIHSFALSERHVILVEHPSAFHVPALMGLGAFSPAPHVAVDWSGPARPTLVHVVSRTDGRVVSVPAPPLFFFHSANAFDAADGSAVSVDLCAYADPAIVDGLRLSALRSGTRPLAESRLTRLTVPLRGGGAARAHPLDDPAVTGLYSDFPAIHPDRAGREHRYVWAAGAERPTAHTNAITKTDLAGGGRSARWVESGGVVGEPWFVPRPGAAAEDDGAVLTTVAEADGRCALLLLDAATLAPLCRLRLPGPLPFGFHGTFVPAPAPAPAPRAELAQAVP